MEKIELTEQQIGQIEALSSRLTQSQLADYLGFTDRTLRNIFDRDERALSAYKKGRARVIEEIAGSLIDAALGGDAVRQMFYLKTQAGWKETQDLVITASEPFDGFAIKRAESNPPATD